MADADTLRVVAELVDKMSAPLKQIRQVIKETGTESDKQWRTQKTQQEQLDRGLVQTPARCGEVFSPALGMVGMSTLSVGAAITATLAATTNFGGEMRRLDLLSKQSTMGVNFAKSLERVASIII